MRVASNLRDRWGFLRDYVLKLAPSEFLGHISFVREMHKLGVRLRVVLDLGANQGLWTRWISRSISPKAKFYLFEPQEKFGPELQKLGFWFPVLLSDEAKSIEFYSIGGTGDSYFVEKSSHYREAIPTSMMSSALQDVSGVPSEIDLVKIDTQGSELDILRGFGNLLQFVRIAILEIPVVSQNKGAPTFDEYLSFMDIHGFSAWKIVQEHRSGNQLSQVDIGFVSRETWRLLEPPSVV